MSEDQAALSPAENAYFESGGKTDPTTAEPAAEPAAAAAPAAEPVAEQAAEQAEATPDDPAPDARAQKTVPLAALKEARNETKELRDKYNREMAKLTERLDQLQRMATQPAEARPADPTWDEKPIEAGKMTTQQVQQIVQERAQERYVSQLSEAFNHQETQFAGQQPDYHEAVNALKRGRMAELETMFPDASPIQRLNHLRQEALMLAETYLKRGENPAAAAYRLAVARGWKAPAPAAAPVAPRTDETTRLATVAKGKDASKSLGAAGSPSDGHLTVERLLAMDDDDFSKISEKEFRRLAGA